MADLIHPDSDWARLGAAFLDRGKPFSRLVPVTREQVAAKVLRPCSFVKSKSKRSPRSIMGRPKKMLDPMVAAALRQSGRSWARVAAKLGVHRNTLLARRKEIEQPST